ncbi:MAG: prepilin-type N-terminal cleavage/methylation domain-containing protein [Deltaproteobacteria bacterium]|nr:prepilin-type N-terminal cleavage/methylation domain-containing protein [Deltaproteobacteria bacterium]
MWTRSGREQGFTLLEVLMALGLLSIALLAVFRLQTSNLGLQSEARFLTEAGCALQRRCSEILSRSEFREGVRSGSWKEEHPGLSYREEITQVPGRKHLYKARVKLFQDPQETSRALVIETYLWSAGG